jgi:hypothetical protein
MSAASGDDRSTASAGDIEEKLAVGARARVHPDTDAESLGLIVEDFGDMPYVGTDIGTNQIAKPARRWAVVLDDGTLVFVDSHEINTE